MPGGEDKQLGPGDLVRRHRPSTRLWHWLNALAVLLLLMSGLMIFNAHPRLYWGEYGANFDHAWLEIGSNRSGKGMLRIGGVTIPTTGLLGISTDAEGRVQRMAFPGWMTVPSYYSLAAARIWHMAFAWVLAVGLLLYLVWSLVNGHIRRDLRIDREERRWRHIWADVREHARLRFPGGAAALRYGVLQKLSYIAVLFVLLPLAIATGLAMSPAIDAAWPWIGQVLGGRQSARSVHFLAASGLAAFTVVHLLMVLLSGPFNQLRAMISGRYRLPKVRA